MYLIYRHYQSMSSNYYTDQCINFYIIRYQMYLTYIFLCARMKVDSQLDVSNVHNCFNLCYNSPNSYIFAYNKGKQWGNC